MLISSLRFRPGIDKLKRIISWVILGLSLAACRDSLVSVAEINDRKLDKTVYLTGKVVQIAPFVEHAAYQIEDATGKIWVVTTQVPPQVGESINLKGQIKYQSLPFAEQELGELYLVELEQAAIPADEP
ncbi:MAG: hypothetical protein AAFW67_00640 [Cyanobacteria bacterium J06638_38]